MSLSQTTTNSVFKGISMREVTGYLTDDGAFYESETDAERHEATLALNGAYKQYVGEKANFDRFTNVIINLAPEIRRLLNAIEGAERAEQIKAETDAATAERETRHKRSKVDIYTSDDGLGGAFEGLEQQPDRGPLSMPDVGDRSRTTPI
jgi:hypothetical protein